MADQPASDFSRLTIAERLQLVADIWDSIPADSDSEALPVTEAERALMDERLADFDAPPEAGRSWADVRARIFGRKLHD